MDTLGNPELEAESISALILADSSVPQEYVNLCMLMSSLSIPELPTIEEMGDAIKKKYIDKLGLLKSSHVVNFLKGKDEDMYLIFQLLYEESSMLYPMYEVSAQIEQKLHFEKVLQQTLEQEDVSDKQRIAQSHSAIGGKAWEHMVMSKKLEVLQNKLSTILSLYGSYSMRLKEKKNKNMDPIELKRYLTLLEQDLMKSGLDPLVIMCTYKALCILAAAIPNDSLDPSKVDVMDNIYDVFCNPQDYYSYCKQEKIIDQKVGSAFYDAYPEYFKKFSSMYVEDYEQMDYQDQINFQKCFDMVQDNSQTISMCSLAYKIAPQQQGQPQ